MRWRWRGPRREAEAEDRICGEHAVIRRRSSSATRSARLRVQCSPYRPPIARLAAAQARSGNLDQTPPVKGRMRLGSALSALSGAGCRRGGHRCARRLWFESGGHRPARGSNLYRGDRGARRGALALCRQLEPDLRSTTGRWWRSTSHKVQSALANGGASRSASDTKYVNPITDDKKTYCCWDSRIGTSSTAMSAVHLPGRDRPHGSFAAALQIQKRTAASQRCGRRCAETLDHLNRRPAVRRRRDVRLLERRGQRRAPSPNATANTRVSKTEDLVGLRRDVLGGFHAAGGTVCDGDRRRQQLLYVGTCARVLSAIDISSKHPTLSDRPRHLSGRVNGSTA